MAIWQFLPIFPPKLQPTAGMEFQIQHIKSGEADVVGFVVIWSRISIVFVELVMVGGNIRREVRTYSEKRFTENERSV